MSKKRFRIRRDDEAIALGFETNSSKSYYLTKDQERTLLEIRTAKKMGIPLENLGTFTNSPYYWDKSDPKFSFHVRNPLFDEEKEDFRKGLIEEIKNYSPNYPKLNREKIKGGHLLVIDIADLHINKYAETFLTGSEYNSKIAVERALQGTQGIIQKASGFHIDKILFVIGNDVLNIDNSTRTTTKGTPQDTDVNWFTAFNIAKDCYIKCIELCIQVADVDVIHCPSNHDYVSGCFLAETLDAWFRNCDNVKFETSPKYRKYYQYHLNMIELEHGDKGRVSNLPLVMAQEEPIMWATTKYRYGYLHHVHHQDKIQFQSGKDYIGVNVTYLRSPSSPDLWHSEQQFINLVAVEGFVHSKEYGRVSHITHYF